LKEVLSPRVKEKKERNGMTKDKETSACILIMLRTIVGVNDTRKRNTNTIMLSKDQCAQRH